MDKKHEWELNDYAVKLIKRKAYQLVGQYGFQESDREDIEQDLILDLLNRFPKYDPQKSHPNGFVSGVVEHKVSSIIESKTAAMRDTRRACSLNETVYADGEEERTTERGDTIDLEEYLLRTGRISRPIRELRSLVTDINELVANLPPDLRELCEQLKVDHATEIARQRGVGIGSIYWMIGKLRRLLENHDLEKYL